MERRQENWERKRSGCLEACLPSATTCLSPFSLPRNQSHPGLSHFCANLYPFTSTARLRRTIFPIYTAQIVQLPLSALRTAWLGQPPVNAVTPWLLVPRSPCLKVFRLLQ